MNPTGQVYLTGGLRPLYIRRYTSRSVHVFHNAANIVCRKWNLTSDGLSGLQSGTKMTIDNKEAPLERILREDYGEEGVLMNKCWCWHCQNNFSMHMILCPDCGNKRCPKANHHDNACTSSNRTGQKGSAYEFNASEDKQ